MESKGAILAAVLASGVLHLAVGASGWPRLDRSLHPVAVPVEVELLPPTDGVPPPSARQRRPASLPQILTAGNQTEPRRKASPTRATAAHSPGRAPSRFPAPAPLRAGSGVPIAALEPRNEPGPGLSGQARSAEQPNLRVSLRPVEPPRDAAPAEPPAAPTVPAKEEEVPEVRSGGGGSGPPSLGPPIGVGRSGLTSGFGLPNPLGAPDPRLPGLGNGAGTGLGAGGGAPIGKGTGAPGGGGPPGGTDEGGRERPRNAERALPERPSAPAPRNERPATTPVVPQPEPSPAKPEPVKPEPAEPLLQVRARYRRNPAPDYPDEARRRRQEGVVLLRVQVNAKGRVEGVEVERSSGTPSLDQAATRAVRRWEFEPARRGDAPVASTVTVPVRFRLE